MKNEKKRKEKIRKFTFTKINIDENVAKLNLIKNRKQEIPKQDNHEFMQELSFARQK